MTEDQGLVRKYGQPMEYDRHFRGPMQRQRSCTDVPCLLMFVLFLCGWGFIGHYAIMNGDLNKLSVPTDSLNRKCGLDSQVLGKRYLFFFNLEKCIDPFVPLTGCPTRQVCVESCPQQSFDWDTMKNSLTIDKLKSYLICSTDADKNNIQTMQQAERAINEERCARRYVKSAPFLNRCMWELSPQTCEFIPSFLRNRREVYDVNKSVNRSYPVEEEATLKAMAFTLSNMPPRSRALDAKLQLPEEPAIQCKRFTELSETVIKEKMRQTESRLAKFVGNVVGRFTNDTRDAQQIGEAIVEDIINSWDVVFIALVVTLIVSLIFIALMRWLASPILWLSILGVLVGLVAGVYFSVRQYNFWKNTATVPNHSLNLHSAVKNILQESSTWLYLSIFLAVSFVIIFLAVIVLRKRIVIAIALTKEGSKAVSSVISTVFFPIFSWVCFIAVVGCAVVIGLYLGSIGEPTYQMIRSLDDTSLTGVSTENCVCSGPAIEFEVGKECIPTIFQKNCYVPGFPLGSSRNPCVQTSCSFLKIQNPTLVTWFIVYNIFGLFWVTFFIAAFSDMVLAMTFATWYWTLKKRDVPFFTLGRAFRQTIVYHLGTVAFGSLILAICRMIRVILEWINAKLKKYDNSVTRAIMWCLRCFFWLLETFLKFLNQNAYIMCAIHGKSFCTSAKDAFNLIMRNFLRVITLDKVTDFLFFLSQVLLTGAAGVGTYFFLKNSIDIQLHYIAVPITLVVIGAFFITSVFFSVYSMAVDTLFLCFLEDSERNDGTPEKPYYMSKQLMKILGKHNTFSIRGNMNQRH